MLSELENTSGNGGSWKKLKEIQCHRVDSINSLINTQFAHSKPLLFYLLPLFSFLANIHEYQKEAHVLKIDSLYHVTHSVLCGKNNFVLSALSKMETPIKLVCNILPLTEKQMKPQVLKH